MPSHFATVDITSYRLLYRSVLLIGFFLAGGLGIQSTRGQSTKAQSVGELFFSRVKPPHVDYSNIEEVDAKVEQLAMDSERLRVAFLGNTLVHRSTEFGYLEAELTRLLPHQDMSFRNLGWPGDSVTGSARAEFGPGEKESSGWRPPNREVADYGFLKMMKQLGRERPHILFVAYGSNVAFEGNAGLARFRAGLVKLLDVLRPTGVRIVLVSPPPREAGYEIAGNLAQQNRSLKQVAQLLGDIARQQQIDYVDLFSLWPTGKQVPGYTDNRIHLNAHGYQILASLVADELLPEKESPWAVQMNAAEGSVVNAKGAKASNAKVTRYGLRWKVTDELLSPPYEGSGKVGVRHTPRRLRIVGLEPGTYMLDIDGRRVVRAAAEKWAEGMEISTGPDYQRFEQLRQSILKKNRLYFYRYRPQNKTYIHLFRSHERGHHAAEIERFALLVNEAEEEIMRLRHPVPRIYELVRETDYPDHEVPNESFAASIEDELAAFTLPEGFEINLFASDPMISKPLNINWDERGRMWVSTSTIYPHLQPGQTPNDRILILEDIDHDGHADKSTVFADDLLVPHSVLPGNGGAYVTQSTDLLFLRDTDGDGRADYRRVLLTGFGNADVHHMIHQLRWGPGGDLYFNQSIYINSSIETPWGVQRCNGSCVWRLRPETLRLEKFATGLVNPWGHAFDAWGQSFATDGAGGEGLSYVFPGAAYRTNPYAGRELVALNPGRPKACGLEFLSGRHLPTDWQNTYMTNDFRANRSTRYRTGDDGSGYASEFLGDMITSGHRGFRPIDIKMGPDGALYIADWYNLIMDHGEVDFHHPLRDKQHGRIWRLTAKNSALLDPPRLANAPVGELLNALRAPEQWTRNQARRLLRESGLESVIPVLREWVQELPRNNHDLVEALWVCQGLRTVDRKLLEQCLTSEDYRSRAAAVRVLSDWHDRIDESVKLLGRAISDSNARVRLEAVNALRRVGTREAVSVALQAVDQPTDPWLDFALFRTVHELRDVWLPDFQAGKIMFDGNPRRIAFALLSVGGTTAAEPLAAMLQKGQIHDQQLALTLLVLASFGDRDQCGLVLDRLPQLPASAVHSALTALLRSSHKDVPVDTSEVVALLDADDQEVRRLATELAGHWKIVSAMDELEVRAADASATTEQRLVAGEAIVAIDKAKGIVILKNIYEVASTDDVRATTIAAWSRASVTEAVSLGVTLFASQADLNLVTVVADALMNKQHAPGFLVNSLQGVKLRRDVAQLLIDRVRFSGQEVPELVRALRTAGGLKPLVILTPSEITQILKMVPDQGDTVRGQEVFRRKETQCTTCHAVKGDGGRVGPDLSTIGTELTSNLLKSLLEPSANIKQGYSTVQVITNNGQVFSGVLLQRTDAYVRLRDANNKERTFPIDDLDEMIPSKLSIMPAGLVETLTRAELVDLVRYLSSLGRPGKPHRLPKE
ncbi:MAG: PVC-type heme-binding CxxCH protein [Pirellulales bacterium]